MLPLLVFQGLGGAEQSQRGRKAVVFLSSCDDVELHYELLAKAWEEAAGEPLLPAEGGSTCVCKLHGDMPQTQRTASFLRFTQVRPLCPAGRLANWQHTQQASSCLSHTWAVQQVMDNGRHTSMRRTAWPMPWQ